MNSEKYFDNLYARVGKNIAFFRKKKKLNQEQLADKLGLGSQSLISQYENAKKIINLERIKDFADYFEIDLEHFIFVDYSQDRTSFFPSENILNQPILKLAKRTYYGYYICEANNSKDASSLQVANLELKILTPLTVNSADVLIYIEDRELNGKITIDDDYAYISARDNNTNFYLNMIFYYYKGSKSQYYKGGMSLITKRDRHHLPVSQYCIISVDAISSKKHNQLKTLLTIDMNTDCNNRPSRKSFSSNGILRLTKSKDNEVFNWLNSR